MYIYMQFKSVKPSPHAAATVDYILSVFECVCVPGCMYVSGYFKALLIKQFFCQNNTLDILYLPICLLWPHKITASLNRCTEVQEDIV